MYTLLLLLLFTNICSVRYTVLTLSAVPAVTKWPLI